MERWHVCVSGYLQHEGRPTGIARVWQDLHALYASRTSVILLRAWSDCQWSLAEWIWRLRGINGPPAINLYGYSWGGYTAVLIARELARRSLPVEHLVLADAVYRHRYALGQWRAFVPWRIVVPANVRQVTWFVQRSSLPRGHRVVASTRSRGAGVAADPARTQIGEPIELDCDHQYADDHREFYWACRRAAAEIEGHAQIHVEG